MRSLRAWLARLAALTQRRRLDRELSEELAAHLQMHVDDNVRLGMSAEEARRQALLKLGGLEQTLEQCRDRRGAPLLENLLRDVRYAIRSLYRSPAFTAVAAAVLALGIGGTTAVFTVVHSLLLRPLPYPEPDRLVMIWERPPQAERRNVTSMENFLAWRERSRSFEALSAFDRIPANLLGPDEAVQVTAAAVTADFFRVLRVDPVLGRTFASGEDAPGAAPAMVLTHGFWLRRFGGRTDVIGKRVSVNARHHEVIGVMPSGFAFPDPRVQLFVPLPATSSGGRNYSVIARLRRDAALSAAREEMLAIAARISEERPKTNAKWGASVVGLHEQIVGDIRRPLLVLLAAIGFVLLIACANVANLWSMRSTARAREIDIRLALGAGAWRLFQQLAVESLVLAGLGALAGVACAWLGTQAIVRLAPATLAIPRLHEISMDRSVLLFAATVTVATATVFGIVPAFLSRRHGPALDLRQGGRSVTPARRSLQRLLVVAEVALALPLLVGAGLMIRSFIRLNNVEPGFRAQGVLTVRMLLLPVRDRAFHAALVDQVLESVRTLPQVSAAGSIGRLPMDGGNSGSWYYRADRPEPALAERPGGDVSIITPGYFDAMGIPLLKGRDFDTRDRIGSAPVAILNRTAAKSFFGDEEPLGKRLKVSWNDAREVEIVGIAGDIRHGRLQHKPDACLFLPNAQQPFPFSALVIRTTSRPAALAEAVKREIRRADPDQGIAEIETLEQLVGHAKALPKAQTLLFALFGVLALALACVGIYGVLAYSVAQRTREIGIRVALGASPTSAFGVVVREGLQLTVIGLAIGVGAATMLARFLRGLLFEVQPLDPVAFASVTALLAIVAGAACAVPASRASWIDPATVLRHE